MDENFRLGFEAGSAFQLAVTSAAGQEFEVLKRAAGVLHGALEKAAGQAEDRPQEAQLREQGHSQVQFGNESKEDCFAGIDAGKRKYTKRGPGIHHEDTKGTKKTGKKAKVKQLRLVSAGGWPGAKTGVHNDPVPWEVGTEKKAAKQGGDRGTRRCSICGTSKGSTAFEAGGGMVCLTCRRKNELVTGRAAV